jgi:PhnB protein
MSAHVGSNDGFAHATARLHRYLDDRLRGDQQLKEGDTVMNIQPYLSFEGRAAEAIDFYKSALGAKVEMIMHFKDAPPDVKAQMSPGSMDKVMHAAFKIGDTQVLASDGRCTGKPSFSGVALTLNAASNAEAEKLFGALGKGGQVTMPMAETFFAHRFGMVADKFGVNWMVIAPKQMN